MVLLWAELHSANACIHVINHTGREMRTRSIRVIIGSNSKISLILNDSTIVSQKSVLRVCICTCIKEINMQEPVNIFFGFEGVRRANSKWNIEKF